MKELLEQVPRSHHDIFRILVDLTDAFCNAHLNEEYKAVCRELLVEVCQEGSPLLRGKPAGLGAGVVHVIGWVNFLGDPGQTPHMKSEDIAKGFGVSHATMMNRSREIRGEFDIIQLDPHYTISSMLDENPYVWMHQSAEGFIIDLRDAPREVQEVAFEQGLIPYVPSRRDEAADSPRLRIAKG